MEGGKLNFDMDTTHTCPNNTFLLKRLNVPPDSPSVQVDFSPLPHPSLHHPAPPSFPVFNPDACFFTPAFILDLDKQKYVQNACAYESMHQSKVQQLSIEKQQLLVARPSRSNSFCCMCKVHFDDYLTHVNMPRHQQLMRNSEFTLSIVQLCTIFEQQDVEAEICTKGRKKKKIGKSAKATRGRRGGKGALMTCTSNLDFSAPARQQIEV